MQLLLLMCIMPSSRWLNKSWEYDAVCVLNVEFFILVWLKSSDTYSPTFMKTFESTLQESLMFCTVYLQKKTNSCQKFSCINHKNEERNMTYVSVTYIHMYICDSTIPITARCSEIHLERFSMHIYSIHSKSYAKPRILKSCGTLYIQFLYRFFLNP